MNATSHALVTERGAHWPFSDDSVLSFRQSSSQWTQRGHRFGFLVVSLGVHSYPQCAHFIVLFIDDTTDNTIIDGTI